MRIGRAWRPKEDSIRQIEAELEVERSRYDVLNKEAKQLILKEKIARDQLVEDYVITTICCQAEIYRVLSEEMAELVKRLPADKVGRVQSQIRDLAAIGGPEIKKQNPSSFNSFVEAALGVRTYKEQREAKQTEVINKLHEEEERHQKTVQLAAAEQLVRDAADTRPGTGEESETPSAILNARHVVEEVVVAIYKHDVEEDDELPFDTGDEILVLSKDDSGW